ncbi:MAG TPA: ABC transporter substrate-binding protein [Streptosporangiaceae bacterium]|nr:ABC transporter substrate-binding protein [Streptosporangiaceae bacterium]
MRSETFLARACGRPLPKAIVLAVVGATALAACGSSPTSAVKAGPLGAFGQVPPAATGPEHAGTISVAMPPDAAPSWILPLITTADNTVASVTLFDYQMWRPLYWYVNGVQPRQAPSMSLADGPVWSDGDKTVSVTLKSGYRWSDGAPITSRDVLFWYDMMVAAVKESPSNWAAYTPGLGMPDQVASVSTPAASTVVFRLKTAVNPAWFTENEIGAIQPMPAHVWARASAAGPALSFTNPADARRIYNFLAAQSRNESSYAADPLWQVVDGPYKLTAFSTTTGAFTMAANHAYGGPHAARESAFRDVPFTSGTAELDGIRAGSVDVGYIPLTSVPEVQSIKSAGYNVFGYPDFGWTFAVYNFRDSTGDFDHIIGQLYIRQAIAHLEDEPGIIRAFADGAAGPGYGPLPQVPVSPYTPKNATADPYPFSVADAVSLLKSHGWKVVPGGTDTCARPGTGASDCGAGIPAGTRLAWNLIYNASPDIHPEQDTALASEARKAGIQISLASSNFNYMISNYNDASPAGQHNLGRWAMEEFGGDTNSTYPTTFGVFNTGGSGNVGGYSSPAADKLIRASLTSPDPEAVTNEAAFLTDDQPSLFEPNVDAAMGTAALATWKTAISGPPASFESLTQSYLTPEFWYFTK